MNPKVISAIHACRKQVAGLEDEAAWRGFLAREAGVASLRAMTGPQLGKVLDALHRLGARKVAPRLDDAQHRMARGLWIDLYRAGSVRDGSDKALDRFVHRVTRVGRLAWCGPDQAGKVVEALKSWAVRAGLPAA